MNSERSESELEAGELTPMPMSICSTMDTAAGGSNVGTPRQQQTNAEGLGPLGIQYNYRECMIAVNLVLFLLRSVGNIPHLVFVTAATIYHKFVFARMEAHKRESGALWSLSHNSDKIPTLTLAVAAFFVSCKVEGMPFVRLWKLVEVAYECPSTHPHFEDYRKQVLQAETMILHTLQFNLLVLSPLQSFENIDKRLKASLDAAPTSSSSSSPSSEDQRHYRQQIQHLTSACNKLVSYSCYIPLCTVAEPSEIVVSIFLLVAQTMDMAERVRPLLLGICNVSADRQADITHYILEFMARAKKRVDGNPRLMELVEAKRPPAVVKRGRGAGNNSAGIGKGSDRTPTPEQKEKQP